MLKNTFGFVLAAVPVAIVAVALIAAWKRWAPDTWKSRIPL